LGFFPSRAWLGPLSPVKQAFRDPLRRRKRWMFLPSRRRKSFPFRNGKVRKSNFPLRKRTPPSPRPPLKEEKGETSLFINPLQVFSRSTRVVSFSFWRGLPLLFSPFPFFCHPPVDEYDDVHILVRGTSPVLSLLSPMTIASQNSPFLLAGALAILRTWTREFSSSSSPPPYLAPTESFL